MNTPAVQPAPQTQTPAQPAPAYQAPRVTDLGAWQAVTLINSVPINPATGLFDPTGGNNGY